MALTQDEIMFLTWHMSGGNNVNPDMSIGGPISPYQLDIRKGTELFSPANYLECENGVTKYRCIYVTNHSVASDIKSTKLWVELQDKVGGGQSFELGLGGFTTSVPKLDDEKNAPTGVSFVPAETETNALTFDLNAGQTVAIWIKCNVQPGTEYFRSDMVFRLKGTIYL